MLNPSIYYIRNEEQEFWNAELGWVYDQDMASVYTHEEYLNLKYMPDDGYWDKR